MNGLATVSPLSAELTDRLRVLRAGLLTAASGLQGADVTELITEESPQRSGPLRVIVLGETKRGKSTLVNTLVGRPLLSPVGVDITTACWLEIGYGEQDQAEVLLADSAAPGTPRRMPCDLRDLERFVAVTEVTDPVIGVQVRIRSPLLRNMVLIDTPGVGGLVQGHAQSALSALRHADALLFVSDARQPILAPEVDFLLVAAARVPTVVVAVTKCDVNPNFEVVLGETRKTIAKEPSLRGASVYPIAAPLADRANEVEDEYRAMRLAELSGISTLVSALTRQAAVAEAVRVSNAARRISTVAHLLVRRSEEFCRDIAGDARRAEAVEMKITAIASLLKDRRTLMKAVRTQLDRLRTEPARAFDRSVSAHRARYRDEAERGAAAQLTTLAPRMVADLTAAGTTTLEGAIAESRLILRRLLDDVGAVDVNPDPPAPEPGVFSVDVDLPTPSGRAAPLSSSIASSFGIFSKVFQLLAGSAVAVSVLTGPGVVAASIALAAGTGWWQLRAGDERERRAQLGRWVDQAAEQARTAFEAELGLRVCAVEEYLRSVLPELMSLRQAELAQLREDLRQFHRGTDQSRREALDAERWRSERLRALAAEIDTILSTINT